MKLKEKQKEFNSFLKKNKYPESTPDWLIQLIKKAFFSGILIGEKKSVDK